MVAVVGWPYQVRLYSPSSPFCAAYAYASAAAGERRRRRRSIDSSSIVCSEEQRSTVRAIQKCGVIACLRARSAELALETARLALDEGISVLEITMTTPNALQVISELVHGLAHPYLLADNRHYPFYLWRKVIHAHWLMKYLLIPLYVYSWWSIFHVLEKAQKKIWLFVFFFAAAGVLVPAPLIEFRYYTIPFYFIILHTPIKERTWILIGMQYIIINLATMSLFLFRPFHWDHESGTQRFIW